jgi:hypothetical protein
LAFAALAPARMVEFHIAPDGHDGGAGTAAALFATIERAQRAARERPRGNGAVVWLHAGEHRLERTLRFGPADGGTLDAPVVYSAADATPVANLAEFSAALRPPRTGAVRLKILTA